MTLLVLLACAPPVAQPPGDDSAPSETGDDSGTPPPPACQALEDPGLPMDFASLTARLGTQHCLSVIDQGAMSGQIDRFHAEQRVWCDEVYRMDSPDGLTFSTTPQQVREHASVSDVMVTATGTHVVVFNDLSPTLLMDTLVSDPERFWRQGLLGLGGLGMIVDDGAGFQDAVFDAHLASLQELIDPDLAALADGTFRFVWFGVPVAALSPDSWDPYLSAEPHAFFRTTSSDFASFPTAPAIVSCSEGEYGEADPSVVSLADGGEVLYAGALSGTAKGWRSEDGVTWDDPGTPTLESGLPAGAPDLVSDGAGGYRMYFVNNQTGREEVATSLDGETWAILGPVMDMPNAHGGSVARAPDGTWWIYFNIPNAECMAQAAE